jgi:hypothetical protein
MNGAIAENFNQFDVAPISLDSRTDEIDDFLHAVPQLGAGVGRS